MDAKERNSDGEVSTEKKLNDLYDLVDEVEIAMMTTRRSDGYLVSRPMATQARDGVADLWFVTSLETNKLDELEFDPHVNLAYYRDGSREWVSVSGTARLSRDRDTIHRLYEPDWRMWFGDEGGARDGGPDDPRIALVLVEAHSVHYLKKDRPAPLVLFELARGMVTGTPPRIGDQRELGPDEL